MKIEIQMMPYFWLSLARHDVDVLMKLAEHHYDSVCRAAGKPGHFLYGWFNITRDQKEEYVINLDEAPTCSGSRRELDTVLKICEGARLALAARIILKEDVDRIDRICATIITAFQTATLACQATQLDPITGPTESGRLMWATSPGRM